MTKQHATTRITSSSGRAWTSSRFTAYEKARTRHKELLAPLYTLPGSNLATPIKIERANVDGTYVVRLFGCRGVGRFLTFPVFDRIPEQKTDTQGNYAPPGNPDHLRYLHRSHIQIMPTKTNRALLLSHLGLILLGTQHYVQVQSGFINWLIEGTGEVQVIHGSCHSCPSI